MSDAFYDDQKEHLCPPDLLFYDTPVLLEVNERRLKLMANFSNVHILKTLFFPPLYYLRYSDRNFSCFTKKHISFHDVYLIMSVVHSYARVHYNF